MHLNPDGMQRFHTHLKQKLKLPCGLCGGSSWQFDDTIFELRQFAGGNLPSTGQIKPVLSVTCNNCGNVNFINALTTGVIHLQVDRPTDVPQENLSKEDAVAVKE